MLNLDYLWYQALHRPWYFLLGVVQIGMIVDAFRRGEWMWVWLLLVLPGIGIFLYYFYVLRAGPSATVGFQLPGAHDRRRIKELQAQIHNLDKPHHYLQLGDIYFQKGNLKQAEECYRASLERDGEDIDARAHMGQCLLRLHRASEARPLLEQVCREKPMHDYGHSLMAYAETLTAVGETDAAMKAWNQVLENHGYARARVQLAELYLARNQRDLAQAALRETLNDDAHAPGFQRRRDRSWIRKARRLLRA